MRKKDERKIYGKRNVEVKKTKHKTQNTNMHALTYKLKSKTKPRNKCAPVRGNITSINSF